jgi:hypothetical protein
MPATILCTANLTGQEDAPWQTLRACRAAFKPLIELLEPLSFVDDNVSNRGASCHSILSTLFKFQIIEKIKCVLALPGGIKRAFSMYSLS